MSVFSSFAAFSVSLIFCSDIFWFLSHFPFCIFYNYFFCDYYTKHPKVTIHFKLIISIIKTLLYIYAPPTLLLMTPVTSFYIVYSLADLSLLLCFWFLISIPDLKVIYASTSHYFHILYLSVCLPLPGSFTSSDSGWIQ